MIISNRCRNRPTRPEAPPCAGSFCDREKFHFWPTPAIQVIACWQAAGDPERTFKRQLESDSSEAEYLYRKNGLEQVAGSFTGLHSRT